jgi:hypothetical protein
MMPDHSTRRQADATRRAPSPYGAGSSFPTSSSTGVW